MAVTLKKKPEEEIRELARETERALNLSEIVPVKEKTIHAKVARNLSSAVAENLTQMLVKETGDLLATHKKVTEQGERIDQLLA